MTSAKGLNGHVWRRLGFGPAPGDTDAGDASSLIESLLAKTPTVPPLGADPWGIPSDEGTGLGKILDLMGAAGNPLQERLWWTLHGLVVCGIVDSVYYADVRDHMLLARRAVGGAPGGYKQYLLDVSTRPGMLKYLSGFTNVAGHPNENYARELLELFSIGRVNPTTGASNYDQNDVREIARALTGWQYDWNTGGTFFNASQWDPGQKTFLGAPPSAAKLPDVVNAVANHPSWPYYVPARLFRDLVGVPASASDLSSLAAAWGATGDIRATVSAIVRSPAFTSDAAVFAKVKTPVELMVGAARLLGISMTGDANLSWYLVQLGQQPLVPPNVAGWPPGDRWLASSSLVTWSSIANAMAMRGFAWNGATTGPTAPTAAVVASSATAATAADYVLHMAGLDDASPKTRSMLNDYATASGPWGPWRAAALLNLLLLTPDYLAN